MLQAAGGHQHADPAEGAPDAVSPAQVLLRWALQRGTAITPKTASEARMRENAHIFDFELSEGEMHAIDALVTNAPDHDGRLCWRSDPLRLLDFD